MAIIHQVDNILNRLMSQYRGTMGFIDSFKASDFTWHEFSKTCGTWNNSEYFIWG